MPNNTVHILKHFDSGKSYGFDALSGKPVVPARIPRGIVAAIVRLAIDFDAELRGIAKAAGEGDFEGLEVRLTQYHQRRRRLVPDLVALIQRVSGQGL